MTTTTTATTTTSTTTTKTRGAPLPARSVCSDTEISFCQNAGSSCLQCAIYTSDFTAVCFDPASLSSESSYTQCASSHPYAIAYQNGVYCIGDNNCPVPPSPVPPTSSSITTTTTTTTTTIKTTTSTTRGPPLPVRSACTAAEITFCQNAGSSCSRCVVEQSEYTALCYGGGFRGGCPFGQCTTDPSFSICTNDARGQYCIAPNDCPVPPRPVVSTTTTTTSTTSLRPCATDSAKSPILGTSTCECEYTVTCGSYQTNSYAAVYKGVTSIQGCIAPYDQSGTLENALYSYSNQECWVYKGMTSSGPFKQGNDAVITRNCSKSGKSCSSSPS